MDETVFERVECCFSLRAIETTGGGIAGSAWRSNAEEGRGCDDEWMERDGRRSTVLSVEGSGGGLGDTLFTDGSMGCWGGDGRRAEMGPATDVSTLL